MILFASLCDCIAFFEAEESIVAAILCRATFFSSQGCYKLFLVANILLVLQSETNEAFLCSTQNDLHWKVQQTNRPQVFYFAKLG